MLCRNGPICKVKHLNIREFNEKNSNERQHVEKVKFVPTKLPIYQLLTITDYQTWCFCLFDLILYVSSTIFQLNRDGSSWVEPVLS